MSKPIKVADELHARLKDLADLQGVSIGDVIEYALDASSDITRPETDDMEVQPEKNKKNADALNGANGILVKINTLQDIVSSADHTNQDPDYWDDIRVKQANINELWAEYHTLTGR